MCCAAAGAAPSLFPALGLLLFLFFSSLFLDLELLVEVHKTTTGEVAFKAPLANNVHVLKPERMQQQIDLVQCCCGL